MKKLSLFIASLLVATFTANAQAPQSFNYQGVARNTSGAPLAAANIGLRLSIHDGSAAGTVVYKETQAVTTNSFGLYNLAIGTGTVVSGTFSAIDWSTGNKYLEVEIDPAGGSSYTSVGTNQLLSVPYAMYAASGNPGPAGAAGPAGPAGSANISGTTNYLTKFTSSTAGGNSQILDNGTSVALGTSVLSASVKLYVYTGLATSTTRAVQGVAGNASYSLATPAGVYGESNSGVGVVGVSDAHNGVQGSSSAANFAGVSASNSGANGFGIRASVSGTNSAAGYFDGGANGYGVLAANGNSGFGIVNPTAKMQVKGSKDAGYTINGGLFQHQAMTVETGTTSTNNVSRGLIGAVGNSTYQNHALLGYAFGPSGSSSIGVYGLAAPAAGSNNSYGVFGNGSGSTNNYGVYGSASSGYAGYFSGTVHVTGTLSKGSGTFKIDHPLDPENKYLYHSFVESPDMMNIYNGNVVTDANGDATITMPAYFEALNKDFRYQLTVIGTFAQAIVKDKMSGNTFTIKTDKPNVEVSWMVTGVRHDKFAEEHRVVPEVDKEQQYKGRYLHAAEWGQPDSKSIDALTRPPVQDAPKQDH